MLNSACAIFQTAISSCNQRRMHITGFVAQHHVAIIGGLVFALLFYFFYMDCMLYTTLQSVNLTDEKKVPGSHWSPFHPLTIKLLMMDHVTHYLIAPMSEYFDSTTGFSTTFYFITPNMITCTHLVVGFLAAKSIFSDSLKSRRIGVLLYEFRNFLDSLDGTVYRSHSENKIYTSHHSDFGFWLDATLDTFSGIALSFSVLFYFWWKYPPKKDTAVQDSEYKQLPRYQNDSNGLKHSSEISPENHGNLSPHDLSKPHIFWICFCYGLAIGLSSAAWDQLLLRYNKAFMTTLAPPLKILQSTALHSTFTWLVFWFWRVLRGEALQQYLLVAIFVNKVWEFHQFVQYIGLLLITVLVIVSIYHVSQILQVLQLL